MKVQFIACLLVVVLSCKEKKEYSLDDFQTLNGYWQITKIIYPDGEIKEYGGSPSVEYINIDGSKGFKKKLYPTIAGHYETSDDAILFRIIKKSDKGFFISYNDSLNGWQESLNFLADDFFSLMNQDGLVFCYTRQKEIKSILDGKTTE